MDWLQSLLSGENGSATQLLIITVALVAGLIFIVWLFRRIASAPSRKQAGERAARLSVTDVFAVDEKRFLVLVRRDDVEHLVMIGGPTDVVVESGISKNQEVRVDNTHIPIAEVPNHAEHAPIPANPVPPSVSVAPAAAAMVSANVVAAEATAPEDIAPELAATSEQTVSVDLEPVVAEVSSETTVEMPAEETAEESGTATQDNSVQEEVTVQEPTAANTNGEETEIEVVELDVGEEASLEAAISENLEDALTIDQLEISDAPAEAEITAPEPTTTESVEEDQATDDEMKKLLDELAGERKEPA